MALFDFPVGYEFQFEEIAMAEKIRVLIADDHPLVCSGLANILRAEPDIDIVGEARDGLEAIDKALDLKPDVILMDMFMPLYGGLESTVSIRGKLPEAKVLIITISERESDLFQALRFGAQACLAKSATVTEVVAAIRRTVAGEAVLSPTLATRIIAEFQQIYESDIKLSDSEKEVLHLVSEALTYAQIASRISISESMLRTHLYHIIDKLHLKNRAKAVAHIMRLHSTIQ